ncbi:MAG: chorismate mutase [Candidatus Lokiarchaeota archaeon]
MRESNFKEKTLNDLRSKIDEIDNKLITLLDKRGQIAQKIGMIKKDLGLEIYQPERENIIIERIVALSKVFNESSIRSIWKKIIASCKSIQ